MSSLSSCLVVHMCALPPSLQPLLPALACHERTIQQWFLTITHSQEEEGEGGGGGLAVSGCVRLRKQELTQFPLPFLIVGHMQSLLNKLVFFLGLFVFLKQNVHFQRVQIHKLAGRQIPGDFNLLENLSQFFLLIWHLPNQAKQNNDGIRCNFLLHYFLWGLWGLWWLRLLGPAYRGRCCPVRMVRLL